MTKQEQEKLKLLIFNVIDWANERHLIQATQLGVMAQYDYVHKELTELQDALKWQRKVQAIDENTKPFEFVLTVDEEKQIIRYEGIYDITEPFNAVSHSKDKTYTTKDIIELIEAEIKDGFGDVMVTLINSSAIGVIDYVNNDIREAVNYISHHSTIYQDKNQMAKNLIEFRGGLNLVKNKHEKISMMYGSTIPIFAIYDIIHLCQQHGYDLIECLEGSYNVISKRTGKKVNGQYEKD